jgi:hypothetical protein
VRQVTSESYSIVLRSIARLLNRSVTRSLGRSIGRSLGRSVPRSVGRLVDSCSKKKFTFSSTHPPSHPTTTPPAHPLTHPPHKHRSILPPTPTHPPPPPSLLPPPSPLSRPPTPDPHTPAPSPAPSPAPPGQRPHESDISANNLSHTGRFPLMGWWGIAKRIEYICMGSNLLSTDIPPQLNDYFRDLANISILNSFKEFSQPFNVSFLTKQLHASSTYHQTLCTQLRNQFRELQVRKLPLPPVAHSRHVLVLSPIYVRGLSEGSR